MNIFKMKRKAQLKDLENEYWIKEVEIEVEPEPGKEGKKPEKHTGILLFKKDQYKANENN